MHRSRRPLLPLLLVIAGLAGCAPEEDPNDPPVAQAYGNTLHWSDLRQMVPMDATPEDSAAMARSYVDNWLRDQVLLANAERNLPEVRMDVEARLRDYRNSLIIFAYEQAVVDQKLDTAVTPAQMEAYYGQNSKEFALREDILRARWFKVRDRDKAQLRKLERWFLGGRPEDLHELELWLAVQGIAINEPGPSWTSLGQFAAQVPVPPTAPDRWAGPNGRAVLTDSSGTCFVQLLEHRPAGDVPPLALVQGDIRTILLNQRKLQLVADMRDDLYRQALGNGEVHAY